MNFKRGSSARLTNSNSVGFDEPPWSKTSPVKPSSALSRKTTFSYALRYSDSSESSSESLPSSSESPASGLSRSSSKSSSSGTSESRALRPRSLGATSLISLRLGAVQNSPALTSRYAKNRQISGQRSGVEPSLGGVLTRIIHSLNSAGSEYAPDSMP